MLQLCPTLCNPMDCSPPGSLFHGILHERIQPESWSELSCPPLEDPPNPVTEPQCLQSVSSVVQSCLTLCDTVDCIKPGFPVINNSWSLFKLMSINSVMPSNHLISVVPFSSCLQSFPTSRSFLMSQLFASGGQCIGTTASASVLPMNIQV